MFNINLRNDGSQGDGLFRDLASRRAPTFCVMVDRAASPDLRSSLSCMKMQCIGLLISSVPTKEGI